MGGIEYINNGGDVTRLAIRFYPWQHPAFLALLMLSGVGHYAGGVLVLDSLPSQP